MCYYLYRKYLRGDIMTLYEKLKLERQKAGLSQKQLAEKLNMNLRTYGSYERGERDVSTAVLLNICKALSVSSDYLLGRDDTCSITALPTNEFVLSDIEKKHIKKYRELDTHGKKIVDLVLDEEYERCTYVEEEDTITLPFSLLKASAGLGDYLFDENFEEIEVEDTPLANQSDFVIQVDGDSMLPKFENGDKVFVKGQQNIDVGDIGIFIIDGCGYIKQVGNGELISLNSEYPNIELHDYNDVKCIGKVIGKVE